MRDEVEFFCVSDVDESEEGMKWTCDVCMKGKMTKWNTWQRYER